MKPAERARQRRRAYRELAESSAKMWVAGLIAMWPTSLILVVWVITLQFTTTQWVAALAATPIIVTFLAMIPASLSGMAQGVASWRRRHILRGHRGELVAANIDGWVEGRAALIKAMRESSDPREMMAAVMAQDLAHADELGVAIRVFSNMFDNDGSHDKL